MISKGTAMTAKTRILIPMLLLSASAFADVSHWTHFSIDANLPGEKWGTGGPVLADFDGDGDLDIALSRRSVKTAYWYERVDDSKWIQHVMGINGGLEKCLGASVLDVDRDGCLDVVMNQVWFKNPGNLKDKPDSPWPANFFEGGGHDIVSADINGDGVTDIVSDIGIFWFDPADNFKQYRICADHEFHGGDAPRGIGDLDGDGDNDVVLPGLWYENPGKNYGNLWKKHEWPHVLIPKGSYGTSARTWIVDLDSDGKNDIVYSDCDTGWSHVYWVKNLGKGDKWKRTQLADPPTKSGDVEGTGSFHSLAVVDFDGDGDLDVFAGEQEDPDTYMEKNGKLAMKPSGMKERGVIWENVGNAKSPKFKPVVFHTNNPGWHEAQIGDVDGDGDIDIVSKIWNADGDAYHADYWRNDN